ncbi:MAG: SPOR domain-containing protein [Prevotella sp.]|nr:SPOR domain-containing protein [Prevotella sp.]
MELRRHIEILLLRNDCVIVPNLGGFMAHHRTARYDEADGMFIPPIRTLGFNPKLTMTDSLLAQSYADAYDLSFPEAVKRVEHEVQLLKERLETAGVLELPDLGTLRVSSSGRYEFEPCTAGILSPGLYGLGAFEITPLALQKTARNTAPTVVMPIHPASSSINTAKPTLATIMSHIDNTSVKEEEKTISIKVSLLKNLAVTAVAAVALLLFARPVAPGEAVEDAGASQASMLAMPEQAQQEQAAVGVGIVPALCDLAQKMEAAKHRAVTPEAGCHTIVLGCNMPLKNAQILLSQIQQKGVNGAVLFNYRSDNMVVYGSYKTSAEAYEQLQAFQEQGLTGWIMEVKN